MAQTSRPLSPHLSVYRFTITMTMSIVHRITGVAMYFGTALIIWWLAAAAIGGDALDLVHAVFAHWFGQIVMFGYTWVLFHHMCSGVRYFFWDSILAHEPGVREAISWAALGAGLVLALIVWGVGVWL